MTLLKFWLPLVNALVVCTIGLSVAAQETQAETAFVNQESVADARSSDAASASSPAEAVAEQPPRPPQLSVSDEDTILSAPASASARASRSVDTGVRSSTWTETPIRAAIGHELSIEPGTLPLLPEDAPAWVGSLPDLNDDVHRLFVGGQIAESESEAVEGLDAPLEAAVRQYVEDDLVRRPGTGAALSGKLTADYVWKNLIDQRSGYVAKLNTTGQPMYQKWVTVSITPEQRAEIRRWHREAVQRKRLAPIGAGVASLLGCVGLMHLILRRKSGRA